MNQDHLHDLLSHELESMKAPASAYEDFHKARFDYVLEKSKQVCPDRCTAVLDIGRSHLTLRLLAYYDHVTTLGFAWDEQSFTALEKPDAPRKAVHGHIAYDLNDAQTLTPIDTGQSFDLIVFAEVIEHLHTAPELTLFMLKQLMRPGGYMILQTPNAAAFYKRLRLLFGRNPYEKIRIDARNPGHFREYTKCELIDYARGLELEVVAHEFKDYFGKTPGDGLLFYVHKGLTVLRPSFSRGQTLILRKRLSPPASDRPHPT